MDEQMKEKFKEFWQQFFARCHWPHNELAKRLHVGNDTVSRWVNGDTAISPEHLSLLLKEGVLSPNEATKLIRLCLDNLGFSKGSFSSIAAAITGLPIGKDKFSTRSNIMSSDFPRLIATAKEQVDILQTYIPNIEVTDDVLPTPLEKGCNVRILVLKLDSDYLNVRLTHLGSDKSAVIHSLNRLKIVAKTTKSLPGTIEIRAYDFIPYFPYHRIDNQVFTGFYLQDGSSKYPQIGMSVDEIARVFPNLLRHFEEYWNRPDNELFASNRE